MNTVKFSAALVVASSFVFAAGAQAADLSAYTQKVQVNPHVEQIQVSEQPVSAATLSPSIRSAINDLSGSRQMPATKVSRYKFDKGFNVGSIIDSLVGIPLMQDIGRGTDIIYVQQFATAQEAANAKRLCPVGVPFVCEKRSIPTSAKAARQLKANELVSFSFNKSYVGGGDLSKTLFNRVDGNINDGLLIRGEFEAQVSKVDADRVRVRVLVSKGDGEKGNREAAAPFEVFSLSVVGGVSISPYIKIEKEKIEGTMVVTDLVFNLSNAQGSAAYDTMMSEAVSFKDLVNPVPVMATDLGPVYKLVNADKNLPEDQRRVSLTSTMNAKFAHKENKRDIGVEAKILGIGLKLINKKRETTENSITTILDRNGNKVAANLTSSMKSSTNLQILFGLIGSDERRTGSTAVLSMLDASGKPTGQINFVVTQNLEDNKLKVSEQQELLQLLNHRMAPQFAQRMNLSQRVASSDIKDAVVYTRVVFSNAALSMLSQRSASFVAQAAQTYVGNSAWGKQNAESLAEMVKTLTVGLNSAYSVKQRTEALTSLRTNKAFQVIGTGFMMWMMGAQDLENSVAVKLYIRGLNRADSIVQVGTLQNPEALEAAQFVDDELNGVGTMVSTSSLNATLY